MSIPVFASNSRSKQTTVNMSGINSKGESNKRRRKSIELDKMGVWNPEGALSEIREAPSVKRGTLIPR